MSSFNKIATLTTLSALLFAASANASATTTEGAREVTVRLVSSAVSKDCGADTVVERTVTVCDAEGCSSRTLDRENRVSFSVEEPDDTSFEVVASSYYEDGRVFHGDTVVDNFNGATEPTHFTQVVEGKNRCLMSFSYEVL